MLRFLRTALLRARSPFADRIADIPPQICDHMARDIGMSGTDLDRHRFRWPSQSDDRPLF